MFMQFFGNYLLNQEFVSRQQLLEAMNAQQHTHVKLGVLAIDAGFMSTEQVEEVYRKQTSVDQKLGDIAVQLGFLTKQQVAELLKKQKPAYLLLGQELVNLGYMTDHQLAVALQAYKAHYQLVDHDSTDASDEKMQEIIQSFYNFHDFTESMFFVEYVKLLLNNIIRFIGVDFTPLTASKIDVYALEWGALQRMTGSVHIWTGIEATRVPFMGFAHRYAGADFISDKACINDSVGDFLNLQNGLFAVNMSNRHCLEFRLEPQTVQQKGVLKFAGEAFCLPLCFSEGIVNFFLAIEKA